MAARVKGGWVATEPQDRAAVVFLVRSEVFKKNWKRGKPEEKVKKTKGGGGRRAW